MKTTGKIAAFALALAASPAAAQQVGETVEIQYFFPDANNEYQPAVEYVIGDAPTDAVHYGYFDVSMDNDFVFIDFNNSATWTAATFNGFIITDVAGGISPFTSFTLDSVTGMNLDASRLSFNENQLLVNWQGLAFNSDTSLRLGYTVDAVPAAVPEPATWAFMIVGFGAVGASLRAGRRTKSAVATA